MVFPKKYRFALLGVFVLMLAGRWLISGKGYLEDTDELLYLYIIKNYDSLIHFNPEPWVRAVFDMQGQPPEIVLRLFQSVFAYAYHRFTGVPMTHPDALYLIGLFNIGVSLLILSVFSRLLRRLEFSPTLVLLGTLLLGTLVNMNVYTRHILPYDTALLFHLVALHRLVSKNFAPKRLFVAGLWAALGLTNYYGSFMLVFVELGLLAAVQPGNRLQSVKHMLWFLAPLPVLLLFYESLTRIFCGDSYLNFLLFYVDTITQGSFHEGFSYVFIYFNFVEGYWGLWVLGLFFAGLAAVWLRPAPNRTVRRLLLLGTAAYILYGGYVYFFEKMVFFGRVLHYYYPFIVLGVLCLLQRLEPKRIKLPAVLMALGALLNYGFQIADLNRIGYPRGGIYNAQLFNNNDEVFFSYREELFSGIRYADRGMWEVDSLGNTALVPGRYDLVNFAFLMHHPDSFMTTYRPYRMAPGAQTVFSKTHFQSHPFYTLEYCSAEGRRFFLEKKLQLMVVEAE